MPDLSKSVAVCKFHVFHVETDQAGNTIVVAHPVTSEGSQENADFWEATPSGELRLYISNEAAARHFSEDGPLAEGKEFYLPLIPAE